MKADTNRTLNHEPSHPNAHGSISKLFFKGNLCISKNNYLEMTLQILQTFK
jgi:hypothetical protein